MYFLYSSENVLFLTTSGKLIESTLMRSISCSIILIIHKIYREMLCLCNNTYLTFEKRKMLFLLSIDLLIYTKSYASSIPEF